MFFLYAAHISIVLYQKRDWRALMKPSSIAFFSISLLPALLYYGYGIFIADNMRWKLQTSFVPQLILQFNFWDGWLKRVRIVMGFTAFLGGFLSVLIFRNGWQKFLLLGLWAGYGAFVFTFAYHTHTHDYYHLPLIPIVALSLSSGAVLFIQSMNSESKEWYWRILLWGGLLVALIFSAGTSIQARRKYPSFDREIQIARAIGNLVNHSTQTLILDEFYGKSLMYYGEFSGVYWPHTYDISDGMLWNEPEMSVKERFYQLDKDNSLHYFVVTDLIELTMQTDLNSFLRENFVVLEGNEDYIIFDLQSNLRSEVQE